jgi:hypothetical protein
MTLSALHWRRLPTQSTLGSVSQTLDAINAAFASPTYQDGSPRTPGSGSAWTVVSTEGSPTEAVRLAPPYASSIAQRVILAGKSVAPPSGPTLLTPDTWNNNTLLIGISKGTIGAATTWYNANPWTTDTFSGYWRQVIGGTGGSVYCYESEETIKIVVLHAAGSLELEAGAYLDPEVTGGSSAESDGRLYGMWTTGSAAYASTTRNSDGVGSATKPGIHLTGNGQTHAGVWVPGSSSWRTLTCAAVLDYDDADTLLTEDADPVTFPFDAANLSTRRWAGRWREIRWCRKARLGQALSQGGVVKGHIVSNSTSTDNQAWVLLT